MTRLAEASTLREQSAVKWILLLALAGILGISLYNSLVKNQPIYIQLSVVFGLGIAIVDRFRVFGDRKPVALATNTVLAVLALGMLILGVLIG